MHYTILEGINQIKDIQTKTHIFFDHAYVMSLNFFKIIV